MSIDTLNKNVLKMLSHLNKYPIPDLQMIKDFKWFTKTYNLAVQSGEVTPPNIGGNGNTQDIIDAVNDVIFSGLSFSNTFTTLSTGVVINSSSTPGAPVSDMYLSIPDVVFNSNRVVGIAIELINSTNLQPNDTIDIISIDEDNVELTVGTVDVGEIESGIYRFGWTYLNMQDDVYSVDSNTYDINPSISFYRQLEIGAGTINGTGSYTFEITYYLA
jgi:hypothetical protein